VVLCVFACAGCGTASVSHGARQGAPVQLRRPQVHIGYVVRTYNIAPMVNAGAAVWSMGGTSPNDHWTELQTSALRPWRPRTVVRSRRGTYMVDVRVSRGWFSWIELGDNGGYAWWLWAQSRSSGKKFLVDTSRREGPASYSLYGAYSSLFGNRLAWTFSTCRRACRSTWKSAVKIVTLPSMAARTIAATSRDGCNYTMPSLSPRLLVWAQEGSCTPAGGSDIAAYRFRDHRRRLLTHDHLSSEPSTNGVYVAWKGKSARLDRGSIVLRDVRTGQTRTLARSESTLPVVSARAVAWNRDDLGIVRALDLRQRRIYTVFPPSYQSPWAIGALSDGSGGDTIAMDATWAPPNSVSYRGAVVWVTMP
jgi:hypothetical protein